VTGKPHEEWLKQADYDMDTAEFMLNGGRCFYAVFMCHLSIEKALKGLYQARLGQTPPKVYNLTRILSRTASAPPPHVEKFLIRLNQASVATRYPEDIEALRSLYDGSVVGEIIARGREALQWIKNQC